MTEIGNYRYEGFPLAEKFGWMQGRGPSAMDDLKEVLNTLASDYTASAEAIRAGLGTAGASWQGAAADSAAGALTTVAQWARTSEQAGTAGRGSVDGFTTSFAETKPKVPPPVDVGAQSFTGRLWDDLLETQLPWGVTAPDGIQSDFRQRQVAAQQADQQANAALYAHQAASQQALATFPTTGAPPAVSTNSASATPGGPGVGPGGGAPGVSPAGAGLPGGGAGGGDLGGAGGAGGGQGGLGAGPVGVPGRGAGTGPSGVGGVTRPGPGRPDGPGRGGSPVDPSRGGYPGPTPMPRGTDRSGRMPGGAGVPRPSGVDARAGGGAGANRGGGHSGGQPLPPRGGPATPSPLDPFGSGSGSGGGRNPAGAGMSGMPIGMGGAGAGAQDREHRNGVYLPSDEPFVVDFGYVAPAVLGLPDPDD